jgi:hypothetical protein
VKWKNWSGRLENMDDVTNNRISEINESEKIYDKEDENNGRGKRKKKEDIELQRAVRLA